MIRGVIFDLGNTLIEQVSDASRPLSGQELRLLPGAKNCLLRLRGRYALAILSNTETTTSVQLVRALRRLGLGNLAIKVFTSTSLGARKPSRSVFDEVARSMALASSELAMVGNDPNEDIVGAGAAGMYTIFISAREPVVSCDADLTVDSLNAITSDVVAGLARYPPRGRKLAASTKIERTSTVAMDTEDPNTHAQLGVKFESEQEWRRTGMAWLRAAEAKDLGVPRLLPEYTDAEVTVHSFPHFDMAKWQNLSELERAGRAYRYAGYHFEGDGDRQSSYRLYERSADCFERCNDLKEASRSYFLATMSYVRRFGEVDQGLLEGLERTTRELVEGNRRLFLSRMVIYYRRLATMLRAGGNYSSFLAMRREEKDAERLMLKQGKTLHLFLLRSLWAFLTCYGQSVARWVATLVLLTMAIFPGLYHWLPSFSPTVNFGDAVLFSISRVVPMETAIKGMTTTGRVIAVLQSCLTIVWLGLLINIVSVRSQE